MCGVEGFEAPSSLRGSSSCSFREILEGSAENRNRTYDFQATKANHCVNKE
jgi:hypothetical protein